MKKKRKIFRILKIITLLESGHKKWTARKIADFFDVSVRTFHRDRELMEEIGVPIYYNDKLKTYDILDTFKFDPPSINREEALALLLACKFFKEENFHYQKELETILAKIRNSLPKTVKQVLTGLEKKITFQHSPSVNISKQKIIELENTIDSLNTIKMKYYSMSNDQDTVRKVDPYNLYFKKGAGYLIGYCHLRKEIRLFRIDRIKKLDVLDNTFVWPEDYSLENYLGNVWGVERGEDIRIKLLFSGFAAKYVQEYKWHSSQQIEDLNEDQIIFRVKTGSIEEIKNWILGFGSEVKVLEPEELKLEIKEEIEEMSKKYQKTDV